jgi:SLT domain-containing protein
VWIRSRGEYPWYTPYQFAGNMPIWAIDLDGKEGFPGAFWGMVGEAAGQLLTNGLDIEKVNWKQVGFAGAQGFISPHAKWDKLGKYVQISRKSTNIVNVNSTKSAQVHNERIKSLDTQFHISQDLLGSETGLVNLLLGSY